MSKRHEVDQEPTTPASDGAQEAAARYQQAIERDPADASAWFGLGNAQASLGRHRPASAAFQRVISLRPELAAAHFNKANADRELGEHESAVSAYEAAIALDPRSIFFNNLGTTLTSLDRDDDAIIAFREAIVRDHSLESAHVNLCMALLGKRTWQATIEACHSALESLPASTRVLKILAGAWEQIPVFSNAITCLEHVLQIDPDDLSVHLPLGRVCLGDGDLGKAEVHLQAALEQDVDLATVHAHLGEVHRRRGAIAEATRHHELALELDPTLAATHSNLLLTMVHDQRISGERLQQESFAWSERHTSRIAVLPSAKPATRSRLRIGYVSGCLHEHPVGLFLEPVLRRHDPNRFEIHCYAFQVGEDEQTTVLREMAHAWTDITSMSDELAVRTIHHDKIDILVDLSGHCRPNRLMVFSYRPAPVQATWIGHSSTTGLPTIDYLLADARAIPVADEPHYVEAIERLPCHHLCFKEPVFDVAAGTRSLGLTFSFGCFTDSANIGNDVIDLWATILSETPKSILFLKSKDLNDESVRNRLRSQFARQEIGPERLQLEGSLSREDRLMAHRNVDLVLDPFPVNGRMATLESLWMEIPVLSLRGDRFSGRIGGGILSAVGLDELVAASQSDYRRLARELAGNEQRLRRLRDGLRERLLRSPLCDLAAFTQDLEDAYQRMWDRYCAQTT